MPTTHVPKFGNWEDNDITQYFENARKENVGGFSPNDQEDDPDAFFPLPAPQQQLHSRKEKRKSSGFEKAGMDRQRATAKIDSYSSKSHSNRSALSHQTSNASHSSTSPINLSQRSSGYSNDKEHANQNAAYSVMQNAVKENKHTGTTKPTIPTTTIAKSRNSKQGTSSKKLCCLFARTRV